MKIFSKIFIICLAVLPAYADFTYEIVKTQYDNSNYEGTSGSYYTVRVTEGTGSIYILDKINNLYSMAGNNEVLANNMSSYGYVDLATGISYEGTGNTITTYSQAMNQWNDTVTQTGYELGVFSAGQEIGVWVANNSGVVSASNAYTAPSQYTEFGGTTDIWGNPLAHLEFASGNNPIFFGIYGAASQGGSSGQPLPGVIATLALGSCVLVAVRKKLMHRKAV